MIDQRTERKSAAEFCVMRRIQLYIGIYLAISAVGMLVPFRPPHGHTLDPIGLLIFAILAALALWMIKSPSPSAFPTLAVFWVANTALNIHAWRMHGWPPPEYKCPDQTHTLIVQAVIMTILVCLWLYIGYRRFAPLRDAHPSSGLKEEIGALIKRTMRGESEAGDAATLRLFPNRQWRISCFSDEMVMTGYCGLSVHLVPRDEVLLQDRGKEPFGTDRKVTIQAGSRKWKGLMAAEDWDRLVSWAGGTKE